MKITQLALCAFTVALLAGCGGGGTGAGGSTTSNGGNGGTTNAAPTVDPTPPSPSVNYAVLTDSTGTSDISGTILSSGITLASTTGTLSHSDGSFTVGSFDGSINDTSDFDLPDYEFATDVELNSSEIAIVGISTEVADMRTSGTAAYTGDFSAQLVDGSQASATVLNWDADIQINFAGEGDVDMTFTGGGSDLIDTIRVLNATIEDTVFSGGTFSTWNDGTRNNISGTSLDLNGAFFGYNDSLQLPGETGGALVSSDTDTIISGVFIATAKP